MSVSVHVFVYKWHIVVQLKRSALRREDSLIMLLKRYWNTDGRTILPIFHFKSCVLNAS